MRARLTTLCALAAGVMAFGACTRDQPTGAGALVTEQRVNVNACQVRVGTCDVGFAADGSCSGKATDDLQLRTDPGRRCGCGPAQPQGVDCAAGCTPSGRELCNGKDDDCDGVVDNVAGSSLALREACGDFDLARSGKGLCMAGSHACVSGQWAECEGQRKPQPERCDLSDNDCDGFVDNGVAGKSADAPGAAPLQTPCGQSMSGVFGCGGYQLCAKGKPGIDGDPRACQIDGAGGPVVKSAVKAYERLPTPPDTLVCAVPAGPSFAVCPFDAKGNIVDEAFLRKRFSDQQALPRANRDPIFYTTQEPGANDPRCAQYHD